MRLFQIKGKVLLQIDVELEEIILDPLVKKKEKKQSPCLWLGFCVCMRAWSCTSGIKNAAAFKSCMTL